MDSNDARNISIAGIISGTLSIIGCILVILSYFAYPSCRTFKSRLVVYLSIADIGWTASLYGGLCWYLSADDHNITANSWIPEGSCVASGFFLQWFIVSATLWVATISIYVYCLIVHNLDLKNREWIMHAVCWGIPIGFCMIPFGTKGHYGPAGTWCWVVDPWARLGLSYSFVWSNFILILVLYALIGHYIWKQGRSVGAYLGGNQKDARTKKMNAVFKKLIMYPIVYLIQWVPGSVNRVQNAVAPESPIVALFVVHVLFVMSGGFLNFLAYGIGKRKTIKKERPFSRIGLPKPVDTESATVTVTDSPSVTST